MTLATIGRDQRITEVAHKLWQDEGQPEGQAEAHWARAAAIVDTEKASAKKAAPRAKVAPTKKK